MSQDGHTNTPIERLLEIQKLVTTERSNLRDVVGPSFDGVAQSQARLEKAIAMLVQFMIDERSQKR